MNIWAVVYGNYDPPEVIALYDNAAAAAEHAEQEDEFEVVPMKVRRVVPNR